MHTNSVFIQNYKELLCKSIWVHLGLLDARSNNRLLINRWHLCRLTDIGASKSENKGGPEQSECLCAIGFVGGWCTKKTNQAKVNWETSCVSSWDTFISFLLWQNKDFNPTFLAYAILNGFNSSWRQFDTYFHVSSLLWMFTVLG